MKVNWDTNDGDAAAAEGWAICEASGSSRHDPNRTNYELSSLDELGVFEGDTDVWRFICERALSGSPLHCKALAYIQQEDEREVREICKEVPYAKQAFAFAKEIA